MEYNDFKKIFHIELNQQQEKAVLSTDNGVLLLAVPGSGKTTVLVVRLGYLLYCKGVKPSEILTMTYTVAASRDMRSRFEQLFGTEFSNQLDFRTINSVCYEIIRRYARKKGSEPFKLIQNSSELLVPIYKRHSTEYPTDGDIQSLSQLITYIKNMRLSRDELEKLSLNDISVAPMYDSYVAALKQSGQMDYDDQLVYAHMILSSYSSILHEFKQQYRYICVDEAQDTSKIQHEIIRMLADPSNIFMVGDEDQSIYGFRAAYPDALINFQQDYPGASVLLLEQNYRSTPDIILLADKFISKNTLRHEKHMKAHRTSGKPVRNVELADRSAQYSYILKMVENPERGQMAILYRNNDSAIPLIDIFERRGIPYRCRQSEGLFFSSRPVLDFVDIVRLSLKPDNTESFLRIYYKFGLPISKAAAEKAVSIYDPEKHKTLFHAILSTNVLAQRLINRTRELADDFITLKSDTARNAVLRIRYHMGYGQYLTTIGGDTERLFLLWVLAGEEKDTVSFLERLSHLKELTELGGDNSAQLILSTIHASKGLEYDRVVIIDALDGILPSQTLQPDTSTDSNKLKEYEEERRLFYVAATRAKNELILMSYSGRGQDSSFIEQFCNPPKITSNQNAPKSNNKTKKRSTRSLNQIANDIIPGTLVDHVKFGSGVIIDKLGDIIIVQFADGKNRKLALRLCLQNGLLEQHIDSQ